MKPRAPRHSEDAQLSLFASSPSDEQAASPKRRTTKASPKKVIPYAHPVDHELASALPAAVRLGTSSWSFPGWNRLVWDGDYTERELAEHGLEAYAQHPLLRAVSLDRTHYAPLRSEDARAYAQQLHTAHTTAPSLGPFSIVAKVWDEITTCVFPNHPRYGARAGQRNPRFLDAELFRHSVFAPYTESLSAPDAPFVFELTPMPKGALSAGELITRAEAFVAQLPQPQRYAIEVRNPELLTPSWLDMLKNAHVAHVYSFWTGMPPLSAQFRMGATTTDFTVLRLMLPPFARYEARKADFSPFDRIVDEQPAMRADVTTIVSDALRRGAKAAFVLVNNKAEGSAPLTVRALAHSIASAANLP